MYKNRRTWSPNASAWARVFVRSNTPATTEAGNTSRSLSEAATVESGESRPTDSDWDSIVDRATD